MWAARRPLDFCAHVFIIVVTPWATAWRSRSLQHCAIDLLQIARSIAVNFTTTQKCNIAQRVYRQVVVDDLYIQGEVTSQSLWSRYDRHFVGITRHNTFS